MTDLSPAHLDDEALSAVLDGAGTEAEARHVAGCAVCDGRLGSLRAVAAAVSAPVAPIDPARLDAAMAAALSAQNVVPISVARGARRLPAWLGAAAGIAAVLGVAGLISGAGGSRGGGDEVAAGDADATTEAVAEESGADDMITMDATEPAGSAPSNGLGELRGVDLQTLVSETAARSTEAPSPATATGDTAGGSAAAPCEPELRGGDPALGAVTFAGDGTWDGQPVVLVVFEAGDERRAFVAAVDGCAVLATSSWNA